MAMQVSPCHNAQIDASLMDGRLVGSCSVCGEVVVQVINGKEVEGGLSPYIIDLPLRERLPEVTKMLGYDLTDFCFLLGETFSVLRGRKNKER